MRFRDWLALKRIPEDVRLTHALLNGEKHVLEINRKYRINVGRLYVLLIRWEHAGLVESKWGEAPVDGRPARREYHLARPPAFTAPVAVWNRLSALVPS